MARFNKANVIANLKNRINILVEKHSFDLHNGWSQLKNGDLQRSIAYGELMQCQRLLMQIEDGNI